MFYDNFLNLCAERRESPSGVARKIGLSNAAANGWKNGKMPSDVTLAKLAQYFSVTTDRLLTDEQKEKTPTQEGERNKKASSSEDELAELLQKPHMKEIYEALKNLTPESLELVLSQVRAVRDFESSAKKEVYPPWKDPL